MRSGEPDAARSRRSCGSAICRSTPSHCSASCSDASTSSLGAWIVPLFVAPIFIARQAFASYIQLRAQHEGTLSTLVRALEAKDSYTAGHVERVANFAEYMGRGLDMKPAELERLRYVALMHDIGKLIVPNQILNKPGKLTAEEFERMRRHEHVSVELLRRIDFLAPVAPSLEAEAVKGSGADPNTPIEARIVTVADAFDAMTSTRAYRRALTQEIAFEELRDKVGHPVRRRLRRGADPQPSRRAASATVLGHEVEIADFATPPPVVGTGSAGLGDLASETGSESPGTGRRRRPGRPRSTSRSSPEPGLHEPQCPDHRRSRRRRRRRYRRPRSSIPSGRTADLAVLAAALVIGELVDLRPARRAALPLSFAVIVVLVRAATPGAVRDHRRRRAGGRAPPAGGAPEAVEPARRRWRSGSTEALAAGAAYRIIVDTSTGGDSRAVVLGALTAAAVAEIVVADVGDGGSRLRVRADCATARPTSRSSRAAS